MNAIDVLKYGDLTLRGALDGVPDGHWNDSGVCGYWSAKDILAHMTAYELALGDTLAEIQGQPATPLLTQYRDGTGKFNDDQVDQRADHDYAQVLAEYEAAHARVMTLVGQFSAETLRTAGTIPWYGADYSLDDFIVYTNYGHKREHSTQLADFRTSLIG